MTEGATGVRFPMDDAPVERRQTFLHVGLALVLLAGQPAFLGDQVFTTGWVLRGVLLALLTAIALLAAWQGATSRPRLGRLGTTLLWFPLGVALLGLPPFGDAWATAARAGRTWILMPLLGVALLWTWRRATDAAAGMRTLVMAGALAGLMVLLDRLGGFVGAGPFGRSGVAGPVLGALVGPALLLRVRGPRFMHAMTVTVLIAGCLATGSRVGMLAMPLGVLASLAAGLATPEGRKRARLAFAGTSVAAVVLLGLMVEGIAPIPGPDKTIDVRLGLHRASLDAMAESPLRGHGLGSYAVMALRYRDVEEARLEPGRRAFHAHNDYLHAGVEGGWLATLLLVLAVGGVGLLALRGKTEGAARRAQGAAAGIVATLGIAAFGDGVLVDPAPALLFAVAVAALLSLRVRERVPASFVSQLPLVAGAGVALLIAFVLARDAMADAYLMRYRHAIQGHPTLAARTRAATKVAAPTLEQGALRWRPELPEAHYRLGALRASTLQYGPAREAFRKALAADPGLTEARLDLAQVYQLEDRGQDARTVLEEAVRHDPTRFDIPRRMGDLLLGLEPVPGDPAGTFDDLTILQQLNEARTLAPQRFENLVDEARYMRRRALDGRDLALAGAKLREAMAAAPGDPANPPAEILLESFHLAEAEGQPLLLCSTILMQALARNPAPAMRYRAQADRFLDTGADREQREIKRAGGDPSLLDMRSAQRAFDAAAVRYTALLYTGLVDPETVLTRARMETESKQFRRALALYRSLLAWTLPPKDGEQVQDLRGDKRLESIARQGDLLLEAAKVAQRVDAPLARFYRTQGRLRIGVELLEKGQLDRARMTLQRVVTADPDIADAHFALARVFAGLEEEPRAEFHLLEALRLKPALKGPALGTPDLKTLRRREKVKLALGIP